MSRFEIGIGDTFGKVLNGSENSCSTDVRSGPTPCNVDSRSPTQPLPCDNTDVAQTLELLLEIV